MIPSQILDQVPDKCTVGIVLALASDEDGAVMEVKWCNKAFTKITGYSFAEAVGKRGTILIGEDTEKGKHLLIIEKLMNWEQFSVTVHNNRKGGARYWHEMSWVPLSDSETGNRWWLCSLFELPDQPEGKATAVPTQDIGLLPAGFEDQSARVRALEKENARLYELAKAVAKESNEDSLTGLSNRRHFEVELKSWITNLLQNGEEFAVLYIDLDRFKLVNDTLGHAAGDRLLVSVATMLRQLTDDTDFVARLGGDEFVVLKPLGDSALSISGLADEIVQEMQAPFEFEGKSTSCSASVGVAIANANLKVPEQVVADADTALYHAKSQGRGRWSFFTEEMHADSIATKQLVSDLLKACKNNEFTPFFQPLICAETGKLSGAEVLVRWLHPTRGLLAPQAFIGTAANMGILKRIDEIVFGQLGEVLSWFDEEGVDLPQVAVNVSAGRLADPSLIHDIKRSGINPNRLTIEILESVYLEQIGDAVRWTLDELADLGTTIAVDDFGTGHASVQGLLKIRPSVLKIDRQFVRPIVEDEASRALAMSIVSIGKSLDMRLVAEGVETEAHALHMCQMGCDYLQGFHFGRPMCAQDLRNVLETTGGRIWAPSSRHSEEESERHLTHKTAKT